MKRMAASNILIVGVKGLGIEIGAYRPSKPLRGMIRFIHS